MAPNGTWHPDILGPDFSTLTLPLGVDAEGELMATLVRCELPSAGTGPLAGADVLYVHGWSDYFFQADLARTLTSWGARFFALDLRKYGRSLRPWQTPGYVEDLSAYDDEIGQALRIMGSRPAGRKVVLLGHSTGGLTLSLWAHRHPGRADALILNSPWLEFQASKSGRNALMPLVDMVARMDSHAPMLNVDLGFYSRAVNQRLEGEWDYNESWRPERGFAVRPGWLRAVLVGHAQVATGLTIDAPVLSLLSARSTLLARWSTDMLTTDSVLVVNEIAERSTRLGASVSIQRVDGALHDVFLSHLPARNAAYAALRRWAGAYVGTEPDGGTGPDGGAGPDADVNGGAQTGPEAGTSAQSVGP